MPWQPAQRAVKISPAAFRLSGVAGNGFFSFEAPLGTASRRAERAINFSTAEGSSVALKPRRIKAVP
jgi:hypothetical protein